MSATQKQINIGAALHGIANGVVAGMPPIHAITVGVDPITAQVCGSKAAVVDAWLAFFDPAATGEVTVRNWSGSGMDRYAGRVKLAAGEVEFWTAIPNRTAAGDEPVPAPAEEA